MGLRRQQWARSGSGNGRGSWRTGAGDHGGVASNESVTQTMESGAERHGYRSSYFSVDGWSRRRNSGMGIPAPEAGYAMRLANA